jgi:hypothetical protein
LAPIIYKSQKKRTYNIGTNYLQIPEEEDI